MSDLSAAEKRLKEHGYEVPHSPPAVGNYVSALRTGSLVVTSGQLPFVGKTLAFTGKVGSEVAESDAQHAARLCVLNALAQIKTLVGSLDDVVQVVRLDGFVQSATGFHSQPVVMNAASELLVVAFGEAGRHTRTAVGVNELPLNAAVEAALWVEVKAKQ